MLTLLRLPKSYKDVRGGTPINRGTYGENKIFQSNFNLNPVVVGQCWPDKVRLCDRILIRSEDNFRFLIIDV
jgi:hypothetical protein